jgi:hypothetical protein
VNAGVITALATGIPAIIGAIVALIRQLQHANNPAAHKLPPLPPQK